VRLSIHSLDRPGRDIVSGLVLGYEADALNGIDRMEQVERLSKWRRQGWSAMQYHYNILALLIGYAQAERKV
jgi:hypothetical protein